MIARMVSLLSSGGVELTILRINDYKRGCVIKFWRGWVSNFKDK